MRAVVLVSVVALSATVLTRLIGDPASSSLIDVTVSVCAVLTMVTATVRRRPRPARPWVLLTAAAVCRLAADLAWYAHGWTVGTPPPEVWLDDAGYVAFYLLIIAGMSSFAAEGDQDVRLGAIDTAVVSCGLATVMWVALAEPVATADSWAATTEVTATVTPVLDLIVTTIVLRWLLSHARRAAQPLLLGAAFLALLFADHTHLIDRIAHGGAAAGSDVVNIGWISWYVLLAAAMVAPPHVEPPAARRDGRPRAYVVVFGALALLGPLATLVAIRLGDTGPVRWWGTLVVPVIITAVLTMLLILRIALLARDARQHAVSLGTALAEQQRLNLELDHSARHDARSGLLNLSGLGDCATQAGTGADGELMLIELDRFDEITQAVGHHAARDLLRQVAGALTDAAPARTLLAQLDGAQFAAYTAAPCDAGLAGTLLRAMRGPFVVAGIPITVEAHAGVAAGADVDAVLQRADTARHAARRSGARYARWHPGLDRARADDLQIVTELNAAVGRDELRLHYQPIVGAGDGRLHGFEALLRWQHPRRGLLSPADFIVQAEHSDVIEGVTDWVVAEAVAQLGRWHHAGMPVGVSVNISAAALRSDDLACRIADRLAVHRVPARHLTVEITETAIMADPEAAQRCLAALRSLGCRISIDDFGTGHTSLAMLTQLPVDELKIDRMFVAGLGHSTTHGAIARGVIAIAQQMGLTTVAEGIEDAGTAQALTALAVDLLQGYHFARPQPPEYWQSHPMLDDTRSTADVTS